MKDAALPRTRLYGRRKGRPLHVRKIRLMRELLPKLEIKLSQPSDEITLQQALCSPPPVFTGGVRGGLVECSPSQPSPVPSRKNGRGALKASAEPIGEQLDPTTLFTHNPKSIWLEIGFGGGEHLAAQALRRPSYGFIGCEPFVNGIASLLDHIDRENIGNIRIFPDDARLLCDTLPPSCVERCYVLFADPWPKAKHAERRFIGPENLPRLARILEAQGQLYLATDDARLADWMLVCMRASADFEEIYNAPLPPADWVPTRYEQKAIKAGRAPVYRIYRRVQKK
jgi:tRNA (guanine-N7-)-methyltransferase